MRNLATRPYIERLDQGQWTTEMPTCYSHRSQRHTEGSRARSSQRVSMRVTSALPCEVASTSSPTTRSRNQCSISKLSRSRKARLVHLANQQHLVGRRHLSTRSFRGSTRTRRARQRNNGNGRGVPRMSFSTRRTHGMGIREILRVRRQSTFSEPSCPVKMMTPVPLPRESSRSN